MKTRKELLKSREYWIAKIQTDLFNELRKYMQENNLNKTKLAKKLNVTKGYVTQILNGDFDHKISKLVDLSLAVGKAPLVEYDDLLKYIEQDEFGDLKFEKIQSPSIIVSLNQNFQVKKEGKYYYGEESQMIEYINLLNKTEDCLTD